MVEQLGLTRIGNIKCFQGLSTDTKPTADVGSGSKFKALNATTGEVDSIWVYSAGNTNTVTSNGWWQES